MTPDASVRGADNHAPYCEAESDHKLDCATATELARLRAFAEAVRDSVGCTEPANEPVPVDHYDACLHCAAEQALERAR